jgi:DNA-binding NarL/FixJ family response regulator
MTSVENKLDFEFFQHTRLDQRERQILKMLLSGYSVSEIQTECRVNERELEDVCRRIGDHWESFYQEDNVA